MSQINVRIGEVIDGFTIEEKIHVGGMAIIYRASHPDIEGRVIFKVPKIVDADDATVIVGFEMEMMILPRLSGIHVPKVYAVGDYARRPYIAMEYIDGETLYPLFEKSPIPPEQVAAIGEKVATALVDLHRQKVIHHDIKPSNIMIRKTGEAVFIDFGLSRHLEMPDLLEAEFRLPMGTAPYISPEQVRQNRGDPRSDIFSLGVLLYHLATGERPFGLPQSRQALRTRLWRDPVPPRKIRPDIPPWLQEIILRCVEPNPAKRYQTAARLAFNLQHPDAVKLTERAERLKRSNLFQQLRAWLKARALPPAEPQPYSATSDPIIVVCVDLSEGFEYLAEALFIETQRVVGSVADARLACINVMKLSAVFMHEAFDSEGRNKHVQRLVELKEWARPLGLEQGKLSFHVLEAMDIAESLLDFARTSHADQILICARGRSNLRRYLGSVSSEVVARAHCTVTVVRAPEPTATSS
ncbi:MAG TPA: bifunctional serine/threonine-protein kinase/universal stress protein [Beijerinckiaceae bacterium]|jgi:serine/threonine protein kinase|nr:bifunctional serine/threonine-protein kinase/universal stress protein [Beijerinckiaceae bacterium]